jgi:hypothetical protein
MDAYDAITKIEPDKIYEWGIVKTVEGVKANVLLGKNHDTGSSELEHFTEWDGKTDPFFTVALEEIESILTANEQFSWDYRPLLRLQMGYALLWTAIERYAGMRYYLGKSNVKKRKIEKIADDPVFGKSLKKHVARQDEISNSADPNNKRYLDPTNPLESINYYYQVRSNSVHRGKAVFKDFDILRNSLQELLAIFKDLLKDAWSSGMRMKRSHSLEGIASIYVVR